MPNIELNSRQIAAISLAAKVGRFLQIYIPEIADEYRNGKTLANIVEDHELMQEFDLSLDVAKSAVGCAIRGDPGSSIRLGYEGLINDQEELNRLRAEHIRNAKSYEERRAFGLELLVSGRGLFGMTTEERKEIGDKLYREGKGIHALDSEGKRQAAIASNISKGLTPWSELEYKFTCMASRLPEYQKHSMVLNGKIADELNKLFHNGVDIRNKNTVLHQLVNYRKSLGKTRSFLKWTKEQECYLLEAIADPDYLIPRGIDLEKLSLDYNTQFHAGELVRSKKSISHKLAQLRKLNGIKNTNRVGWNDQEYQRACELLPALRFGLKYKDIASVLNNEFHSGDKIRSGSAVSSKLYDYAKANDLLNHSPLNFSPKKWTEEEKNVLGELTSLPEYRRGKSWKKKELAAEINARCHDGEKFRNPRAVYNAIKKYIE
tara:strand:- start:11688 stop:12986 length:1299 start_codon:yes stop_codon:yes gene_type:complete